MLLIFKKAEKLKKNLIIMKYTIFFMIFGVFEVIADESYSQPAKLTIDMQDATVAQVISQIENVSQLCFTYNTREIDPDRKVSIQVQDVDIDTVLKILFADDQVNYILIDEHVALYKESEAVHADSVQQSIPITGIVTDADGNPQPGVNVKVKGMNLGGAITNVNGEYSLSVPDERATLIFSSLGFITQEVIVGNTRTINIQLIEDTMLLEEVVVIGYGMEKRRNLTGAVGTASGSLLENRPIVNIGEGLQGVIPNLKITPSGTAPGQGASFNVRGYTSLNGGSPLILVDGVVQDPNLVNPNDIESVTVLKDASAAAIYGARAAYGVILFTTKSGKKNERPTFNISTSFSNSAPIHIQHSPNSLDYVNMMNLSARNSGSSNIFGERQVKFIEAYLKDPVNNLPVYYDPFVETDGLYGYCGNTDWADILYRNGGQQQYNVSMRGGSENTRYFASYGLMNQQGVLSAYDQSYQRHTVSVDLTTDINKWLTFGAKTKYTHGYADHPSGAMSSSGLSAESGVLKADLPPFMPVYHPDGSFAGQGSITNPFAIGKLGGYEHRKTNDLWLTGKVTIRPLSGLNINADFTFNPYSYNNERVVTRFMERRADGSEFVYPWSRDDGVTRSNSNDYYTSFNAYLEYMLNFGKNNFKITTGYNQEIKTNLSFNANRLSLIDRDTPMMTLSLGNQTVGDSGSSWAVQGIFGRLHYNFDEKYLIDITGRYDGSSKFAKGHRFAIFPSIAGA